MGGIGTGAPPLAGGIPIINAFVKRLSQEYFVTVLSLNPVNEEFSAEGYELFAPQKKINLVRKTLWLYGVFRKVNSTNKIDLIHALWGHPQGLLGVLLKYLYKIPLVIHLQGGDSTYLREIRYGVFRSTIHRKVVAWAYQRSDELVVLTKFQQTQLAKFVSNKEPIVIPFGVKVLNKSKRYPSSPHTIIHIGHINHVKDQETLLRAFEIVRSKIESCLIIIGQDTLSGKAQRFAKKLGILDHVDFKGVLSHQETLKLLADSSVMMHSSLYEAQGLVINEALALGVPVCGTHVGLVADLAGSSTLSTPPGDGERLAHSVLELLKTPDLYEQITKSGVEWAQKHDLDWTMEQFRRLYLKLLET